MNGIFILALAVCMVSSVYAQHTDSIRVDSLHLHSPIFTGSLQEDAIFAGYRINYGDSTRKEKYHILELGLWQTEYVTIPHPANRTIYISSELVLNSKRFVIGPKAGLYFGVWLFCGGSEMILYTDFRDAAVRWSFYAGIGTNSFKLTCDVQAKLLNTNFELVHFISLNLSVQMYALSHMRGRL